MTQNVTGVPAEPKALRVADLGANILSLAAISFAALGLWRVGNDLNWAGDFVIQNGFLSHWQVWIGAAAGCVYGIFHLPAPRAVTNEPGSRPASVVR